MSSTARASPSQATTVVEVSTMVPAAQDGCLDHTVKELGMSAKKVEAARRWDIQAKYLHSEIAKDGTFQVAFEKSDKPTVVRVIATWAGAPKANELQLEIEQRLVAMTTKMAQLCNVTKPEIACSVTPPGGKPGACLPVPTK